MTGLLRMLKRRPGKPVEAIMAMVLLRDAPSPDLEEVLPYLERVGPISSVNIHHSKTTIFVGFKDYRITAAHMGAAVPGQELGTLADSAGYGAEWAAEIAAHRGHILLHLSGAGKDPLRDNLMFSQVAAAFFNFEGVVGIFLPERSLLIPPKAFRNRLEGRELPLANWIFFGSHEKDGLRSVYTLGLRDFGKWELEILDSQRSFHELGLLLKDITHYVIKHNVYLQPGETIGNSADQRLKITDSAGVFVKDRSLKIHF